MTRIFFTILAVFVMINLVYLNFKVFCLGEDLKEIIERMEKESNKTVTIGKIPNYTRERNK